MKTVFGLMAGVATVVIAPGMALAQHVAPSIVLNGQVNLNEAQSLVVVNAPSTESATAGSLSVSNSMNATSVDRALSVHSTQFAGAGVYSQTDMHIQSARGVTVGTAVSQGNSAQSFSVNAGTNASYVQETASHSTATGGLNVIAAQTRIAVGSSDNVAGASTSNGNVVAMNTSYGDHNSSSTQINGAHVAARTEIEACCNNESLTATTQAAGNSQAINGEVSTVLAEVDQTNNGAIGSEATISVGSGTNLTAAGSAAGNLTNVQNLFGYAQLDGQQTNNGNVSQSVQLNADDFRGFAALGSTAYGNSAILSNRGSDATIGMSQTNDGTIRSTATFNGSSSQGGVGTASSFAIGNAVSGYTCSNCGQGSVKIEGYTNQVNNGAVIATTTVNGGMGFINATATAIGNSASFGNAGAHH